MVDPSFEVGCPGESSVELARILDRGLRESRAVDTESLCVVAGKLVWSIRVDISSGMLSNNNASAPLNDDKEEEMTKSALSTFRQKEEEIEKKKSLVRERVYLQLGRVEEETKRLAVIRQELEALEDPMRKEVSLVRKRVDLVHRDIKALGQSCIKKEKEYREVLETYNEKNKE